MDSQGWALMVVATVYRYFLFAGIGFLLFYVWKKNEWIRFRIQQPFPKSGAIRTEVTYSLITLVIFSGMIWAIFGPLRPYTRMYADIGTHGYWYFGFSIVLSIFLHDAWFYWTHRLMHWKKIFRYVHAVHHKSHNPSPWAAYAFHPVEAVIEFGIIPLIVFTFPVHFWSISIFTLYSIIMNVMGHIGYELYPARFLHNWWTRWMNTSTHHNMHHKYGKGNYGLYFNIWDSLMGTNHKKYRETFEAVKARARRSAPVPATAAARLPAEPKSTP